MSPDLSRRSVLLLFTAMALAVAGGLLNAPVFDPLARWYRQQPELAWHVGSVHALLAGAAVGWLARLLRHRRQRVGLFSVGLPLLGGGLLLWVTSLHPEHPADARLLLWLQLLPLWWTLAALAPRLDEPSRQQG